MSPNVAISLEKLTKNYGSTRGITEVTFDVNAGEVMGFLGPNGAGKTTAIRTLLGLIKATSGNATILGKNALVPNVELRRKIGYLPGIAATYDRYSALKYLDFLAHMRGLKLESEIRTLARRLDLDINEHIHDLSKGNRQKVSVIQAFMHSPEVLFLDEPTSGLDPLVQREFEKILDEARDRGAAIILSSHVLSEVEHLADRIAIINQGAIVIVDEISTMKSKARRRIDLFFDQKISKNDFSKVPNIKEIEVEDGSLHCVVTGSEHELLKRAVELGVSEVRTQESSLEE
ncbi:MAG: ABC transporter ATP-binding protein, partial [Actinobacteria bacterium]|nr:ABC transporter ATP-binding protein [Actinomycetota bacterium]